MKYTDIIAITIVCVGILILLYTMIRNGKKGDKVYHIIGLIFCITALVAIIYLSQKVDNSGFETSSTVQQTINVNDQFILKTYNEILSTQMDMKKLDTDKLTAILHLSKLDNDPLKNKSDMYIFNSLNQIITYLKNKTKKYLDSKGLLRIPASTPININMPSTSTSNPNTATSTTNKPLATNINVQNLLPPTTIPSTTTKTK